MPADLVTDLMADLVIDLGHSRMQWARCPGGQLDTTSLQDGAARLEAAKQVLAANPAWQRALMVASEANPLAESMQDALQQAGRQVERIHTGDRQLPVAPAYASLGADRWLCLQPPWQEQPGQAHVVLDAGTAITVDLIDAQGRHRGGWIMAGARSALNGLMNQASVLRRTLPDAENPEQPACDTDQALARGALLLAAGGIEQALQAARAVLGPAAQAWLTGGDAARLRPLLSAPVRFEPQLLLQGLALASQVRRS